ESFRDLVTEHLRKHVKLGTAIVCHSAESGPLIDRSVWLSLAGDLATPVTIEADTLSVAILDLAAAMTALTRRAVVEGPGLKSRLAILLKEQPDMAKRTHFLGVHHPPTLLEPVVEAPGGSGQRRAFWPVGYPGCGRQFPRSANQAEALRDTIHLAARAIGDVL